MATNSHPAGLAGKAVVITGAGQGIGAATSRYLAERGVHVVVADINADNAQLVAREIAESGGTAEAFHLDVTSWDGARDVIAFAAERFGKLDGVVNNAGVVHYGGPLDETGIDGARRVFEVNLLGTYAVGLAAIQHMSEHGGGSIVNVTSGVQAGLGEAASYGASKGAVASLTYAWAIDCLPLGIRVNALSPVATTEMVIESERRQRERGQLSGDTPVVEPIRNSPIVAYFLSDLSEGITGQVLRSHGTTLQLLAHPVVIQPEFDRDEWDITTIDETVRAEFGDRLPPLGLTAAQVQYGSISKVNIVPGIDRETGGAAAT